MTIVRRCVWRWEEDDDWHEAIECAVREDGTSPADDFLSQLAAGTWLDDPDHVPPQDDEQIFDAARLFVKIRFLGKHGQPLSSTAVNGLHSGIWEFKHGRRRLTYWDTPGNGGFVPKDRLTDSAQRTTPTPPDGYWWYPDMDGLLRLGCAWPKTGAVAPPAGIEAAIRIRQEDCDHDST